MKLTKADVQFNTRQSGKTTRYHTWPRTRDQSVGEHTWQVMRLYTEIFGVPRSEVFMHILYHDMPEVAIGDPPYPVKKVNAGIRKGYDELEAQWYKTMGLTLPEISEAEHARFKFCDLYDCAEHGQDEMRMGNQYMAPIADQVEGLMGIMSKMPEDDQIMIARHAFQTKVRLDPTQMTRAVGNAYFGLDQ